MLHKILEMLILAIHLTGGIHSTIVLNYIGQPFDNCGYVNIWVTNQG